MLNVILTEEEERVLDAVLEEYLSDLRMEMADTDRADYLDMLRERKQVLLAIQSRIRAKREAPAPGVHG